jgi:hypothetical protein
MRTHDLAKALRLLSDVLRDGPNTELKDLRLGRHDSRTSESGEIAVNLSTLASLSRIDRRQWLAFVSEYDLPITVRPRDASRDILGKMLKYLEENESAREILRERVSTEARQGSPELLTALQALLRE